MKYIANLLNKNKLLMISGVSGVGKTTLSLQLMVEFAKYSKCLIYGMEMTVKQIEKKIIGICAEQNLDFLTIKKNMSISEYYLLTIDRIKQDCLTTNCKFVYINSLWWIVNRKTITEFIEGLKEISDQLDINIIFSLMAPRDYIYRKNEKIMLKDFGIKNEKLIDSILMINYSEIPSKVFELYSKARIKKYMYIWNSNKLIFQNKCKL